MNLKLIVLTILGAVIISPVDSAEEIRMCPMNYAPVCYYDSKELCYNNAGNSCVLGGLYDSEPGSMS